MEVLVLSIQARENEALKQQQQGTRRGGGAVLVAILLRSGVNNRVQDWTF